MEGNVVGTTEGETVGVQVGITDGLLKRAFCFRYLRYYIRAFAILQIDFAKSWTWWKALEYNLGNVEKNALYTMNWITLLKTNGNDHLKYLLTYMSFDFAISSYQILAFHWHVMCSVVKWKVMRYVDGVNEGSTDGLVDGDVDGFVVGSTLGDVEGVLNTFCVCVCTCYRLIRV